MFSGDVTRYLALYIVCWLIALRSLVMTHRHIISTPFKLHSNSCSSTSKWLPQVYFIQLNETSNSCHMFCAQGLGLGLHRGLATLLVQDESYKHRLLC